MKKRFFCLFLFLFCINVSAEKEDTSDRNNNKSPEEIVDCVNAFSTVDVLYCQDEEYVVLEKRLKAKQAKLRRLYKRNDKRRLSYFDAFVKESDKYAEAYCDFEGSYYMGGSIRPIIEQQCMIKEKKRQIKILDRIIKTGSTIPL